MSEQQAEQDTANKSMSTEEYRADRQTEEDIHKAVIEWADRQSVTKPALELLFHVPNGGSRHGAEAKKLKEMGTRQGVPDLLLPYPMWCEKKDGVDLIKYLGIALELKSSGGRLRAEQAWWLRRFQSKGWAIAVERSFDAAKATIEEYLEGQYYAGAPGNLDLSIARPPRHVSAR